ncbi:hypothetical protein ON010_g11719 [Phytophthora cinnamomi]|nr:hypothetical protein ON010_g11719 [Phytophthora cinnamomi]
MSTPFQLQSGKLNVQYVKIGKNSRQNYWTAATPTLSSRPSRAATDAELNVMQMAPPEPSPYLDVPVGVAQQWLDISDVTAIDWYNFCRDICFKEMLTCNMQHPDNWLFGGVDTNLWFGILTGADRKKKTLSPILRKHVKANTTIISDAFASYVRVNGKHTLENNRYLRGMQYTHRWVNHDKFIVVPVTGAHTNSIEGAWEARIKRYLKRMRGVRKELLVGVTRPLQLPEFERATKSEEVHPAALLHGLLLAVVNHCLALAAVRYANYNRMPHKSDIVSSRNVQPMRNALVTSQLAEHTRPMMPTVVVLHQLADLVRTSILAVSKCSPGEGHIKLVQALSAEVVNHVLRNPVSPLKKSCCNRHRLEHARVVNTWSGYSSPSYRTREHAPSRSP